MDTISRLRSTTLFGELDNTELQEVARIVSLRNVPAQGVLFFEGDPATGFFVLLSGMMRIYKASPEGKEFTLHHITDGQMFAEAAIFRGTTYPANCSAIEDSVVLHIPKREFIALVTSHPQIALKIIGRLSAWLREFTFKLENLSLKEVPARLASYVLRHLEDAGGDTFVIPVSKTELATELGTIPETFSRALRKLRDSGVLEVQGNNIKVLDHNRLSEIADGAKI